MHSEYKRSRQSAGDVLVIWNRYGLGDSYAREYEKAGAMVVVVENGYLDMSGTAKTFAMSLNHHNGVGRWPQKDLNRAERLACWSGRRPWQGDGRSGDILLLPQRGIGPHGVAMPRDWEEKVRRRLKAAGVGDRRVRTRWHPAGGPIGYAHVGPARTGEQPTLEEDLAGVGLCVTWGSGAGLKAMVLGVPVLYELEGWIGGRGASFGTGALHQAQTGDRDGMLRRLAWAQWSLEEVAGGLAFRELTEVYNEGRRLHAIYG